MAATATHVDVTETVVAIEIADMLKAEAAADQRAMLLRRVSDALAAAYRGPEGPLHSIADLAAADLNAAAVLRVLTPDLQAVELDVTSHPDPAGPGLDRDRHDALEAVLRARAGPGRRDQAGPDRVQRPDGPGPPTTVVSWSRPVAIRAFDHRPDASQRLVLGLFSRPADSTRPIPSRLGDEHLVQVLADRAGSAIAEHRVRADLELEAAERLQELTEQQRDCWRSWPAWRFANGRTWRRAFMTSPFS